MHVIVYDVANDSKRNKIASMLLDYGDRVQKSVFEAELDIKDVREILANAVKYMEDGDSLRIYPICRSCRASIKAIGRSSNATIPNVAII